jgi:Tfp pilus assembly protein PilF
MGAPAAAAPVLPDWSTLHTAMFDLEIYHPDAAQPVSGVGFAIAGVDGIVTSYQPLKGATRVVARAAKGSAIEITRYIAHDPASDIAVLQASIPGARLTRGTHRLMSIGQVAFVLMPPSGGDPPARSIRYYTSFEGAGLGEMIATEPGPPTGAALVDSLGNVVGMVHTLTDGIARGGVAVPIEHVFALLARPEIGGSLSALTSEPAAWTNVQTPAGMQVLGASLTRARRYAEGLPYISRSLTQDPKLVAALLEWGMALQGQQQYGPAEQKYREALVFEPLNGRAHLYLGSCQHMQGEYAKAQATYEAAIRVDPKNAQLYVNLSGVFFIQKKPAEAERALRQALSIDPQHANAHANLGALLAGLGRREEARAELEYLRSMQSGFAAQVEKFTGK